MKKLFPLALLLLLIISTNCQSSFQGNEEVIILDNYNEVSTLEELSGLPEFKDKILFINLYNFYCKHSLDEFPYIKKLQKRIEKASKANRDIVFIHLSNPKLTFERNWRSNVEDYGLAGYHFLMNEEFHDDFWSHFPEDQRGTPFFLEITKEKEIQKTNPPSSWFLQASLNNFRLQTFKLVKANLDSLLSNSDNKDSLNLSIHFDQSSNPKISFFTHSKKNLDNPKEVEVWKDLKVFAEKSFDSISGKYGLSGYSFDIPLNARTLDSIIPE